MKKTLEQIQRELEEKRNEDNRRNQELNEERERSRVKWLRDMSLKMYEKSSFVPSSSSSSSGGSLPGQSFSSLSVAITDWSLNDNTPWINSVTIEIVSDGSNPPPISERGIVFGLSPDPSLSDDGVFSSNDGGTDIGEFAIENVDVDEDLWGQEVFIRAYVISSTGTIHSPAGLSPSVSFEPGICLAEGTKIRLSSGISKNIEEIEYTDSILVWDFDMGRLSSSKPLWIKKVEVSKKYNLLKFSDGSELRTISQHRIFNKEMGEFTYPMTSKTPVGTTTFTVDGNEIKLISKEIINEEVNYYNVITNKHINMFANGILTSCRYNNIYPIHNMKFIKDERVSRNRDEFNISDKFYYGLRIGEQTFSKKAVERYVSRLESNAVEILHLESI
jgi:hypothetical protein